MKKIEVVCAIIKKDNKILCCQKKDNITLGGYWEFPGGKVEKGETNENALMREIKEELNVSIKVNSYLMTSTFKYSFAEVILHAYECSYLTGNIILVDHQKVEWLDIDNLDTLEWAPADIPIYKNIMERGYISE